MNKFKWPKLFGGIFAIAGLVYLIVVASRSDWSKLNEFPVADLLGPVAICILLYMTAHISNCVSWFVLLKAAGETVLSAVNTGGVLLVSQAAKYLPGSVFQYVGRLAIGRRQGLRTATLVTASTVELAVALSTALIIMILLGKLNGSLFEIKNISPFFMVSILFVTSIAIFILYIFQFFKSAQQIIISIIRAGQQTIKSPAYFLTATLFIAGSHVLIGYMVEIIARTFDPTMDAAPGEIVGLYAAAWLLGFLAVGAPAGIGAREAILVAGLMNYVDGGTAIATVTLHRIVVTFGDGAAYLAGFLLLKVAKVDNKKHGPIVDTQH